MQAIKLCMKQKHSQYHHYAHLLKTNKHSDMTILKTSHTQELFQVASKMSIRPELYNEQAIRPAENYTHVADPIDFYTSPLQSQALHPNPNAIYHSKCVVIDGYAHQPLTLHLQSAIRNAQWQEAIVAISKLVQLLLFYKDTDGLVTVHSGALKRFGAVMDDISLTCVTYCKPDARLFESMMVHMRQAKRIMNQMKKKTKEEYDELFYNVVNIVFAITSTLVGVPKSYNTN